MHFTMWVSKTEPNGSYVDGSWEAFVNFVAAPIVWTDKGSLEGWAPVRCAANYRVDSAVEAVSHIVLDDDKTGLPLEGVAAIWAGVAGLVHTTFSYTPDVPKYRIVLRCSRDMSLEEHAIVWRHVRDLAVARGQTIDKSTHNPSRLWYVPAHLDGAPYHWRELEGDVLDVDAILASTPVESTPPTTAPAVRAVPADSRRHAMALALGAAWPANGRHEAQLALAGALRAEGFNESEAVDFLCDVCRTAGDEDRPKRERTVAHTYGKPEGSALTGWTRLKAHVDPLVVDAARGALGRDAEWTERTTRRLAEVATKHVDDVNPLGFVFGGYHVKPPPTDFLVEGLIPRGCVGMFFGRADSLKTWLLFSLAVAVASGATWLDRFPTKQAKVGIVDYETGRINVLRRLYMLGAGDNPNLGYVSFAKLKPNDEAFWVALERYGFELVMLDSLRQANPGADENDSGESIVPLTLAASFTERTGCSVEWIHHANRAAGDGWPDFRGSSAIEAEADPIFAVKRTEGQIGNRRTVEVRCDKGGDMRAPEPFTVEIVFDDIACTATVRRIEQPAEAEGKPATEETMRAEALKILRESAHSNGIKKANLRAELHGPNEVRVRVIAKLESDGVVTEYREQRTVWVRLNKQVAA